MPYQSKAQQRFFHARLPEHAHKWDQATKRKKHGFKGLPERVGKADDTDAFGVSRPDLVAKAGPGINSPEAKRQRRHVALTAAAPYVGGLTGPATAAHYAPSGHKGSSAARATGRGVGEGTLGATGGAALGSLATRGRPTGRTVGATAGALAGASHGTAMSMKTTQRKYGVQHR